MAHQQDEADIRESLSRRLNRPVDKTIWGYLVEKLYVEEALAGYLSVDALASEYRKLQQLRRSDARAGSPQPREVPADARMRALSWRLGQLAAQRSDVKGFRQRLLGGNLLDYIAVAQWVEENAQADGPARPFLIVPVPPGYEVSDIEPEGVWTSPPLAVSRETPAASQAPMLTLAYGAGGKGGVMRKYVAHGGVLDELRQISESLSASFGWQPAQATVFILTGLTPDIPKALISFEFRFGATEEARIHLDVDASMPAREVLAAYRQARADLAPPNLRGPRRYRRIEEKHAQLARFYPENGRAWRGRMQSWNEAHPEWSYTEVRNFARDCTRAWRRLFREKEAWNEAWEQ